MRVDVVDVLRREARVGDGVANAADDRLAVRTGAGAMEGVGELAAAFDNAEDLGAARARMRVALEHQCARALRHDKTIAIFGKWFGRALRRIVLRGEC